MNTSESMADSYSDGRMHGGDIDGNDVDGVFDALHGNVALSDFTKIGGLIDPNKKGIARIRKIITAPFMQRLRRVKQLGFVSQNFLSAQHNRYSHALGTMHIMRKLIDHLDHSGSLTPLLPAIKPFPPSPPVGELAWLKQHLLVAALIQDIGELPYERATAGIFLPNQTIVDTVASSGIDMIRLKNKHIFTLFFIWDDHHYDEYFYGLSKPLLTFLIAGRLAKSATGLDAPTLDALRALRQMLDGTIDADRLDYVYRDAFHAIGVHHKPDALIDSIAGYDAEGPILSHVRPVTDFMITRAMLWSNVYLSPENRFRIVLLRIALSKLREKAKAVSEHFKFQPCELDPNNFLSLDDLFIDHLVRSARDDQGLNLNLRAKKALDLLESGATDYEYRWIRFGESIEPQWNKQLTLPRGFYFDTYPDYREKEHSLYTQKAVKLVGDRYSFLKAPVYLEDCIGPFCDLLRASPWRALPMPNHMAWFIPRSALRDPDANWKALFAFKDTLQLATQLRTNDSLMERPFKIDTRDLDDFLPPNILISCADEDREPALVVASILFDLHRRYFVLLDPAKNTGHSAVAISERAVDQAGAVIILASSKYAEIYNSEKNGPINAEVSRIQSRRTAIPVLILSLDDPEVLMDATKGLPLKLMTREGFEPLMGSRLREHLGSDRFREVVMDALKFVEQFAIDPK
jgi:HD superfamily phosphohydrolase